MFNYWPPIVTGGGCLSYLSEQEVALDLDLVALDPLIARLNPRPAYILDEMINIPDKPIKPTIVPRSLKPSSIGLLDTFPVEVLHILLNLVDFQSLSRFAQVCHQAKTLVESLFSYQDLMKHASTALIALSRTSLITLHAAGTIHAALLGDKCVSCQEFGPFLFLPTCERCCYECLLRERSMRVVPLAMAGTCFGLSSKDVGQLPMMLSIPGEYYNGGGSYKFLKERPFKLVSVKQAEKLAISVHGSQKAMERAGMKETKKIKKTSYKGRNDVHGHTMRWLSGATIETEHITIGVDTGIDAPSDPYCGVASISFPSLRPNGELEKGFWCLGCQESATKNRFSRSCPGARRPRHIRMSLISIAGLAYRARPRSEFLEHIKDCIPAQDLLRKLSEKAARLSSGDEEDGETSSSSS